MPGIRRVFSGPNGTKNYLPDNGVVTLTRDAQYRIIRVDYAGPNTQAFHRIFTRDGNGLITNIGYWIQDSV